MNELKKNIIKKLINLGIPYVVFTVITLTLKMIFSSSVNNVENGFFKIILLKPTAPYWYLYVLFFFFCVTYTICNRKQCYLLINIAIIIKIISSFIIDFYDTTNVLDIIVKFPIFYIWFILGMVIAYSKFIEEWLKSIKVNYAIFIFFIITIISFITYINNFTFDFFRFILGYPICICICNICMNIRNNIHNLLSKYVMPIFLTHTIFAASLRSLLLKININSIVIHIVLGLVASIIFPIFLAKFLEKTVYFNIILYPLQTIRKLKIKS